MLSLLDKTAIAGDSVVTGANDGLESGCIMVDINNFSDLSGNVSDFFQSATRELSLALSEVASALRESASQATDLPIDDSKKEVKSDAINLWREEAEYFDMLADAVNRLPVTPTELRDELSDMLLHGVDCIFKLSASKSLDRQSIESLMRERSNNIALAYSGRVLPERF